MRKPEEIQRQINGLEAMKEWLPEYNFFGDNNWQQIDDQISILKGISTADEFADEYDADEKDFSPLWDTEEWMDGSLNEDLFETRD